MLYTKHTETARDATIYEDSINVLRQDIETLKTSEIALNRIIEGAKLMVTDKDRQLSDLKGEYERIKNRKFEPVIIRDTITVTVA